MRLLFAAVLIAEVLAGQTTYTGPKGSISGTVMDAVTGFPIRKAQVRLSGPDSGLLVTDASGSFRFEQAPPGAYSISGKQPDYPVSPDGGVPLNFTLAAGEEKQGLEIKLSPAASLSGRIVDEDGDPLPGCRATAMMRIGLSLLTFGSAAADKSGNYTISPAPAGKYYLEVKCSPGILQPRAFAPPDVVVPGTYIAYASRFYPGAHDFSAAQKVKLLPGQTLQGLDFRMVPETFSSLTVTITGFQFDQRRRITASLAPDDGGPFRLNDTVVSSPQPRTGEIRFSVPSGKYILRVTSPPPEQLLLLKQSVQVAEEPAHLTVQVATPFSLTGIVHAAKTDSAPKNELDVQPNKIWISNVGEEGNQLQLTYNPDGSFRIPAISPGKYHLSAQQSWVQSGTIGGEAFSGPDFDVKAGASGPLEINMSSRTGGISGDVDVGSGRPPRIMIVARFAGLGNASTQIELNEATGLPPHFTSRLPPGTYRLYAIEYTPGRRYSQVLYEESLDSFGAMIDIRAGSDSVKNLKLITAEDLDRADQ